MDPLSLYAYLSVLLHAVVLACQSLAAGGVIFCTFTVGSAAVPSIRKALVLSASGMVLAQVGVVAVNTHLLREAAGLTFREVIGANFVAAAVLAIAGASGLAVLFLKVQDPPRVATALFVLFILSGSLWTSHASGRLHDRILVGSASLVHQAATAGWVGGLPFLLLSLRSRAAFDWKRRVCQQFSRVAVASVAALIVGGGLLAWRYIGSVEALYGTSYGVMTVSKVVLLAFLLALGATNRALVRSFRQDPEATIKKLRCFSEAEIGIGFTVMLAAASLTSQPPAVDLVTDRASRLEIVDRLTPRWPRLSSPSLNAISASSRQAVKIAAASGDRSYPLFADINPKNTAGDVAWSEYNHHWAGLILLAIGMLAIAWRSGFAPWARHWPLLFLALGGFILLRADPEGWPLGPDGFFEGFSQSEVLQHRIAVLLVILFGVFEWRVRGNSSMRGAVIFPAVCAVGGAVLLTHSHALGDVKEELMAEMNHLTLALLAVIAGWARWIEVRLPNAPHRTVSWIWPVCFVLIGAVLLDYREA